MEFLKHWVCPDCYFGYNPIGDYLVIARHRESDTVSRSNFTVMEQRLRKVVVPKFVPEESPTLFEGEPAHSSRCQGWIYVWMASHSLVGHIEYLMIRGDAPEALLKVADETLSQLEDYPVLDDIHLSELESLEACQLWEDWSVRDRMDAIKQSKSKVSIFAARRDDYPSDDSGALDEYMRG